MHKMKTKKIVAKRFKVTKNGDLMYRAQGARHLRRRKSKAQQRRQDHPRKLDSAKITKKLKTFLQN